MFKLFQARGLNDANVHSLGAGANEHYSLLAEYTQMVWAKTTEVGCGVGGIGGLNKRHRSHQTGVSDHIMVLAVASLVWQ